MLEDLALVQKVDLTGILEFLIYQVRVTDVIIGIGRYCFWWAMLNLLYPLLGTNLYSGCRRLNLTHQKQYLPMSARRALCSVRRLSDIALINQYRLRYVVNIDKFWWGAFSKLVPKILRKEKIVNTLSRFRMKP